MPDRALAFVNGVVHTVDPALPRAEAIAVRDGRILGAGTLESLGIDPGRRPETLGYPDWRRIAAASPAG